jgi:hypothetical protein
LSASLESFEIIEAFLYIINKKARKSVKNISKIDNILTDVLKLVHWIKKYKKLKDFLMLLLVKIIII